MNIPLHGREWSGRSALLHAAECYFRDNRAIRRSGRIRGEQWESAGLEEIARNLLGDVFELVLRSILLVWAGLGGGRLGGKSGAEEQVADAAAEDVAAIEAAEGGFVADASQLGAIVWAGGLGWRGGDGDLEDGRSGAVLQGEGAASDGLVGVALEMNDGGNRAAESGCGGAFGDPGADGLLLGLRERREEQRQERGAEEEGGRGHRLLPLRAGPVAGLRVSE